MNSLALDAAASLRAINAWAGIIEANITGTQRVAFKGARPSFGNRLNTDTDNPSVGDNKVQIPSAALEIAAVPINFAQGEAVKTELETDMALLGEGYFLVSDSLDNAK